MSCCRQWPALLSYHNTQEIASCLSSDPLVLGPFVRAHTVRKGLSCAISFCQRCFHSNAMICAFLSVTRFVIHMQHILLGGSKPTMERGLVVRRGNAANLRDDSADESLSHRLHTAQAQWQRYSCLAQRCPRDPQLVHACSKVTIV